jgi:hypothetical protein
MNCDDLGERLMSSWNEELSDAERRDLERHLADCGDCRQEADDLEALWHSLGALDPRIEVPSETLRSRFYGFLAEEQRRRAAGGWWQRAGAALESLWPARVQTQAALVAVALVLGLGIGLLGGGAGTGSEIAALRSELASVSETVSLSLLTHPAASERIRGVGLTTRASADERIVDGLLELVRSDPSANVRLAAIEALAGRIEEPGVGLRLLRTLPEQTSPMLQMTLLDVLLPVGEDDVLEAAAPLLESEALDEAVRERLLQAKGESV